MSGRGLRLRSVEGWVRGTKSRCENTKSKRLPEVRFGSKADLRLECPLRVESGRLWPASDLYPKTIICNRARALLDLSDQVRRELPAYLQDFFRNGLIEFQPNGQVMLPDHFGETVIVDPPQHADDELVGRGQRYSRTAHA